MAFQRKADVDAAYARLASGCCSKAAYPAIATHDEAIIAEAKRFAADQRDRTDRFEFQMLYGIRRDLQSSLVAEGYRVRVYVPFGKEWFPYFMRRLGERPANVAFVLRSVLSEERYHVFSTQGRRDAEIHFFHSKSLSRAFAPLR